MSILTGEKPDVRSVTQMLRRSGIAVTSQRISIAQIIFARNCHLSADEVYDVAVSESMNLSRATVYNTLKAFAKQGLIREILVEPKRLYYEPRTTEHHHYYDVACNRIYDIPQGSVYVGGLSKCIGSRKVVGLDVVVRVSS